jgi:DNA mismatch repair protein MutS
MFFDDAKLAAPVLDIALTHRGSHNDEPIPMAGVPVHAAEQYLPRLIRAGHRVAVCEQTEKPAEAKKRGAKSIVNRAVVRIITSGTLTEDGLLNSRRNNYLCAISEAGGTLGLAWADMSTGETFQQALGALDAGTLSLLAGALARIDPSELLCPEDLRDREILAPIWSDYEDILLALPASRFDSRNAERRLCDVFKIGDISALDDPSRAEISALGAVVDYIATTQVGNLPHLNRPHRLHPADHGGGIMEIDAATRRNLELIRGLDGAAETSLLAAIDRTITSAGGRLLGQRVGAPLTDIGAIGQRIDMVAHYVDDIAHGGSLTAGLRDILRGAPDMDRALSRIALGRGGPRDLAAVRDAARCAVDIMGLHDGPPEIAERPVGLSSALTKLGGNDELIAKLETALGPDLPLLARDGGFVAVGYSSELDQQRQLRDDSRKLIAGLQQEYSVLSGVNGLRIKHNNVLGYFIEVTPSQAANMSADGLPFIHRQTLASAVRYTTAELAELVEKITLAADAALAIELELFGALVDAINAAHEPVAETGRAIAELDLAASLAVLASDENYCRPHLDAGPGYEVRAGRHPVVEQTARRSGGEPFVANDCIMREGPARGAPVNPASDDTGKAKTQLDTASSTDPEFKPDDTQADSSSSNDEDAQTRMWLLTGPNMAGKSTFLRQNALIVILAQMGSFVPADEARIGVVDRVFSRVGAADDLARGRSTFMVEMVETATILSLAGHRSFVILDEIGRGTSTFDGLSIAWSVMEHLHDQNRCRTIFATHYHEMTSLAERLPELSCHTMRVKEWRGTVVFLHEVGDGTADRSYGIHVAQLAGLPEAVIIRAREILSRLEASEQSHTLRSLVSDLPLFQAGAQAARPAGQSGGQAAGPSAVEEMLEALKLDEMTPREALDVLYRLRDLLDE